MQSSVQEIVSEVMREAAWELGGGGGRTVV